MEKKVSDSSQCELTWNEAVHVHLPSQVNELNFKMLTALNCISLELHLIIILALKHCCKFLHILFSFASFHMQIVYLLASLLLLYVLDMHSKEKICVNTGCIFYTSLFASANLKFLCPLF